MPYEDRTGPFGAGPVTGWGRGPCGMGLSRRFGGFWRRSFSGRGWLGRAWTATDEKAALDEEEEILKAELVAVRQDKETLKNQK